MIADKNKIFFWSFLIIISFLSFLSIWFFRPIIDGDGVTYLEAMKFLQHGTITPHAPYRILTAFLGMESVIFFSSIFGSIESGWLILSILFYFLFAIFFYKIVFRIFKSSTVAFLCGLFVMANYAMICFGLDYWMDGGGWMFYALSLYFCLRYVESSDRKMLLYSAATIGVGALFKEYAFLAVVPIAVVLIYENWPKVTDSVKKAFVPALLALTPVLLAFVYVYQKFNYTYFTWFALNHNHHIYPSRFVEYIKSLGSLYTFLAFLVIAGIYFFWKNGAEFVLEKKTRIFILSVVLSSLPIFIWPAITQRILFVTVPGAVLVAGFCFKRFEKRWVYFLPILFVYTIVNFTMNAYILPNFNLPF